MLTLEQVQRAVPSNLKNSVDQPLVDQINNIIADPLIAEQVRNNFISFTGVLRDGKFKTEDYLNAVVYVSHKLMGDSNQDAYFKTFPARHAALVAKGTTPKDISAYVSAYHRGKLVGMILEQSFTPVWILNRDIYQSAINTQADLMVNAASEKVRCDAANSILTHLAKPKEVGPTINFDVKESAGMDELKNAMVKLANQQQLAIENGFNIKSIAAQDIIDIEVKDGSA